MSRECTSSRAGDRAKFDSRLGEHLEICRERLVANALAVLYRSSTALSYNRIIFTVSNPTDDPVQGARVVATFYAGDAAVLSAEPPAMSMPDAPTWSDPMENMFSFSSGSLSITNLGYTAPPVSPVNVRNENGFVQITYLIGDLPPKHREVTFPIAIIPGFNKELEELDITLTAAAMNRRSVNTKRFVLAIKPDEGWALENVIDPHY